jgi:hypothetical protein
VVTTIPEPEPEAPPAPAVTHVPEPETPPPGPSGIELSKTEPLPYRGYTTPSPEPITHEEPDQAEAAAVTEYPPADTLPEPDLDEDRPIDEA